MTNCFSRLLRTLGMTPSRSCQSLNCRMPKNASRRMSRVQRSPRMASARRAEFAGIWGTARFAKNGYVSSTEEEGGKFRFAVNIWDGSGCRVFEGSKGTFAKLNTLDVKEGLSNLWVEIGRDGTHQQAPYYVKKVGELTPDEAAAANSADLINLEETIGWYEDEY